MCLQVGRLQRDEGRVANVRAQVHLLYTDTTESQLERICACRSAASSGMRDVTVRRVRCDMALSCRIARMRAATFIFGIHVMCVRVRVRVYIHACMHACMHTNYIHTYKHTNMYTRIHTHSLSHTHTRTHTHTHTHTHKADARGDLVRRGERGGRRAVLVVRRRVATGL